MAKSTKYRPSSNIFFLGLVSLLADASSEIYFAILPFFILEIGGSGLVIGLVAGLTDLFVSTLKGVFGFISDKLAQGRKKFLYIGYGLPSVFKFLMALVTMWPIFLVLRLCERIGKGVRSAPRDAMIADLSEPQELGRNFGFHRAMDSFGAVLGSVFAFILILLIDDIAIFFIISAIVGLLTLIPILMVKDEEAEKKVEAKKQTVTITSFSSQGVKEGYWQFMVVVVLFHLSFISYMFFLLMPANTDLVQSQFQAHDFDLSIIQIAVLLYAFFNIIYTTFSYQAGSLADRYGKEKTILLGFAFYLVSLLCFISALSIATILLGFVFLGLSYAFTEGNLRAKIGEYVVEGYKASGYGVYLMISGLCLFVGNIFAGFIFDQNPNWVLLSPVVCIIFSIVTFYMLIYKSNSRKQIYNTV